MLCFIIIIFIGLIIFVILVFVGGGGGGYGGYIKLEDNVYDYVIVGFGFGGGFLVINFVKVGYFVFLVEVGDD